MKLSDRFRVVVCLSASFLAVLATQDRIQDSGKQKLKRLRDNGDVNDEQAGSDIGSCLPTVTVTPSTKVAFADETFEIRCTATGVPRPTITWSRADGQYLPQGVYDSGSGVLRFTRMTQAMYGYYQCTALNAAGDSSATASVTMQYTRYQQPGGGYQQSRGGCPNQGACPDCDAGCGESCPQQQSCPNVFLPCQQQGCNIQQPTPCPPQYCPPAVCPQPTPRQCPEQECQPCNKCPRCPQPRSCPPSVWCPKPTPCDIACPPPRRCPTVPPCPTPPTPPPICVNVVTPTVRCEPAQENNVAFGSSAELRCVATGNETLHIKWRRVDGNPLPRNVHDRGNGVLSIRHMDPSAEGDYECTVHSEHTRVTAKDSCSVKTERVLHVEVIPKSLDVEEGERALFICLVKTNHRSPLSVVWSRKSGAPLPSSAKIHHTSLTIQPVNRADIDDYVCTASTQHEKASDSGILHVKQRILLPPIVSINPEKDNRVPLCGYYELRCVAVGCDAGVKIKWSHQHHSHLPLNVTHDGHGVLSFRRFGRHAAGSYECTASNAAGEDRKVVTVSERSMLEVHVVPKRNQAVVGSHVRIQCKAKSSFHDPHTYSWTYNGGPLPLNVHSDDTGRLIFEKIDRSHQGKYTCKVTTECETVGVTDTTDIVVVDPPVVQSEMICRPHGQAYWPSSGHGHGGHGQSSWHGHGGHGRGGTGGHAKRVAKDADDLTELKVEINPSILNTREGERETLRCKAKGPFSVENLEFAWTRRDHSTLPASVEELEGGVLLFSEIHTTDSGDYVCRVTDKNSQKTAVATVAVHVNPRRQSTPTPAPRRADDQDSDEETGTLARIIRPTDFKRPSVNILPTRDVKVLYGKDLELRCVVGGHPTPTATWSFATEESTVLPDNVIDVGNGNLQIERMVDTSAGTYFCKAKNAYGSHTIAANVDIQYVNVSIQPSTSLLHIDVGSPVELRCKAEGQADAKVSWVVLNGRCAQDNYPLCKEPRVENDRVIIEKFSPPNAGVYECVGESKNGSDRKTIELRASVGTSRRRHRQRA